ncbi:hypothetical protein D9M68_310660 [compost metagenome]
MTVDGRDQARLGDALEGGEQGGDAGLVVQVAGTDVATLGELRQRVEGDEVTYRNPQGLAVGAGGAVGVQAQFHVVPADGQVVHLGVEGMPRRQQGQHAAAQYPVVPEQADAAAFGEAAGPAAHRRQGQAAVVLDLADDGANGVQVRRHRTVRAALHALDRGADGAAPGQLVGDADLIQPLGDVAHDGVGETGGAGNGEHFQQHLLQVGEIGLGE